MGEGKKDITPLLMHWSYVFLLLTHQYDLGTHPHIANALELCLFCIDI